MSNQPNSINLLEMIRLPDTQYFHREYENDIPDGIEENSWLSLSKRAALVALPLVSLYKPLNLPLAIAAGSARTLNCLTEIDLDEEGSKIALDVFQTAVAIAALAGTIFAHPVGMLITTGQDLTFELSKISEYLGEDEYQLALGQTLHLVSNALYLALLLNGGLEIAIASMAMQILVIAAHSIDEYQKGNYLEGSGHALMACARGTQLSEYIDALKLQWKLEEFFRKS